MSRWGRSDVDTDESLAAEAALLSTRVDVRPLREDAEIVVVHSKVQVDAALLERAPSARLVVTTTNGTDHLDLPELRRRSIRAARLPEARRDPVIEAALGMLLWGLRRVGEQHAAAEAGRWSRAELPALGPRLLRGAEIGIVGLGVIGRRMAETLDALGARVLGDDPAGVPSGVEACGIDAMFGRCEAVTLHCELTPSSRGIVSRGRLAHSRRGLVLVNTARGALVDVGAAKDALDRGDLGALGLDVFPEEPWPGLAELARRPGAQATPHAAGYHTGLQAALREELDRTVAAFLEGRPLPHPVAWG